MGLSPKRRVIQNHHMDSTIWDEFCYRPDDIIIASYIKSGTTWLQQIVGQLLFDGKENLPIAEMLPWLDLRFPLAQEKLTQLGTQTHRRFIKTHLPADAMPLSEDASYLYIARDGRDVVWSMYGHYSRGNEKMYKALNDTPERVGPKMPRPPASKVKYFNDWLEKDGYPIWSYWENIKTWWDLRDQPNVRIFHYNNLLQDLPGQTRNIADFLKIQITDDQLSTIVDHCSFEYMKQNAKSVVPLQGGLWRGGAKTFINKGINNRWKDELPKELSDLYEQCATQELGSKCAYWLRTGVLD